MKMQLNTVYFFKIFIEAVQ